MLNGFGVNRVEYRDDLKLIDREIAKFLAQREQLAEGKWFLPPQNVIEEWAQEFGIQSELLIWIFRNITQRYQPSRSGEIGELQNIVPLMKRKIVNGCVYTLTHVEQYRNGSVVNLTAQLESPSAHQVSRLELLLTLAVDSRDYVVTPHGRQGGGPQLAARFLVTPKLPDDIGQVKLGLVPTGGAGSLPPRIVHELVDPVDFS